MAGRTPNRSLDRPATTPAWAAPALLLVLLFVMAALAACGGGEDLTTRPERATTQPQATEPSVTTTQPQATQVAQSQPTRQGALNRVGAQPTTEPEATTDASDATPKLAGYEDAGTEIAEFASVSAGHRHTCRVKQDGSVACCGSNARGLTAADFELADFECL